MVSLESALRSLPAVHEVLAAEPIRSMAVPDTWRVESVRAAIQEARDALRSGAAAPPDSSAQVADRAAALLTAWATPSLRGVLNATGVVLHTNLGRAPLSERAVERVRAVASGYCNLEYDLRAGTRGSRDCHAATVLAKLTGAEDALVVNNCAAAVFLVLRALARGGEAIVSRGEQVEIGGSFRIPDIMQEAGASMVEVGTTNRTRLADYQAAITDNTRLVVKVNRSNFALVGFTEDVSPSELAECCRERGIPLFFDLGSGLLWDFPFQHVGNTPTVEQSIADGADLVAFSGDKLLGGPQAGILVGSRALVGRIRKHPLARAFRVDKLAYAALEATLSHYVDGSHVAQLPAMAALSQSHESLLARAHRWADTLETHLASPTWHIEVIPCTGRVGGGTMPLAELQSAAVRVSNREGKAARFERALRHADRSPIVARIVDDGVEFDLCTLPESCLPIWLEAVVAASVAC